MAGQPLPRRCHLSSLQVFLSLAIGSYYIGCFSLYCILIMSQVIMTTPTTTSPVTVVCSGVSLISTTVVLAPTYVGQTTSSQYDVVGHHS